MATTLGVAVTGADCLDELVAHLAGRPLLLILDNCEQVVAACAALVVTVLERCPTVAVLATSREPLGIAGEQVRRLPPLSVAADAVTLFVDRFTAAGGAADVDRDVAVRICQRLDGTPLAIELAASRGSVLSAAEILSGLDERFRILRSADRTVPERQRTMSALLDWSYDLLTAPERATFERLSCFAGTFALDAATAAVAGDGIDAYDVPELVWSLADKSLVTVEPAANATRYRMPETVRAYAASAWPPPGGTAATNARIAEWYLEQFPLAQRGNRGWLTRLAPELDTLSALIDGLDPPATPSRASPACASSLVPWPASPVSAWRRSTPCWRASRPRRRAWPGSCSCRPACWATPDRSTRRGGAATRARRCSTPSATTTAGARCGWDRPGSRCCCATPPPRRSTRPGPWRSSRWRRRRPTPTAPTPSCAWPSWPARGVTATWPRSTPRCRPWPAAAGDHVLVALALNNLVEEELRDGAVRRAAGHQRDALDYAAELGMEHLTTFGLIVAARIAAGEGADALAARLHAHAEARLATAGLHLYPDDQALSDAMLETVAARLGAAAYAEARRSAQELTVERALAEAEEVLATAAGEAPIDAAR